MYTIINNNIEIFAHPNILTQHFADYLWLRLHYPDVNITENVEYKGRYVRFWAINASRPSQLYKNHYFELLQNNRDIHHQTLEEIIRGLCFVPIHQHGVSRIDFSYATKLLHTVNNNSPIYDSLIKDFFFLPEIDPQLDFEDRIHLFLERYQFLETEYNRILINNLLRPSIIYIRENYNLNDSVNDKKIIDSIIWAFVKYLRRGGVQNRNILFT